MDPVVVIRFRNINLIFEFSDVIYSTKKSYFFCTSTFQNTLVFLIVGTFSYFAGIFISEYFNKIKLFVTEIRHFVCLREMAA